MYHNPNICYNLVSKKKSLKTIKYKHIHVPSDFIKKTTKKQYAHMLQSSNKKHSALSFSQCYSKQKISLACPKHAVLLYFKLRTQKVHLKTNILNLNTDFIRDHISSKIIFFFFLSSCKFTCLMNCLYLSSYWTRPMKGPIKSPLLVYPSVPHFYQE